MTFVVTFHTHFDVNLFVRRVKTLGTAKMKPVPRKLSSSCGTCVEFVPSDESFNPEVLYTMEYEGFYRIADDGFELLASKE